MKKKFVKKIDHAVETSPCTPVILKRNTSTFQNHVKSQRYNNRHDRQEIPKEAESTSVPSRSLYTPYEIGKISTSNMNRLETRDQKLPYKMNKENMKRDYERDSKPLSGDRKSLHKEQNMHYRQFNKSVSKDSSRQTSHLKSKTTESTPLKKPLIKSKLNSSKNRTKSTQSIDKRDSSAGLHKNKQNKSSSMMPTISYREDFKESKNSQKVTSKNLSTKPGILAVSNAGIDAFCQGQESCPITYSIEHPIPTTPSITLPSVKLPKRLGSDLDNLNPAILCSLDGSFIGDLPAKYEAVDLEEKYRRHEVKEEIQQVVYEEERSKELEEEKIGGHQVGHSETKSEDINQGSDEDFQFDDEDEDVDAANIVSKPQDEKDQPEEVVKFYKNNLGEMPTEQIDKVEVIQETTAVTEDLALVEKPYHVPEANQSQPAETEDLVVDNDSNDFQFSEKGQSDKILDNEENDKLKEEAGLHSQPVILENIESAVIDKDKDGQIGNAKSEQESETSVLYLDDDSDESVDPNV